jgi:hypothetical protein
MRQLSGNAAADTRNSEIDRSDRALPKNGSWTQAPETLAGDHREEVSHTPAKLLKPGKTGPPRVKAEPTPILLSASSGLPG